MYFSFSKNYDKALTRTHAPIVLTSVAKLQLTLIMIPGAD